VKRRTRRNLGCSSTASGKVGESELWIASAPRRHPEIRDGTGPPYSPNWERERDALRTSTSPQAEWPCSPQPQPRPRSAALDALRALDPNSLSPREALDLLFRLQQLDRGADS